MSEITEQQVRELRDFVYGAPTSDKNWDACKGAWMRPAETEFLIDQATKRQSADSTVQLSR